MYVGGSAGSIDGVVEMGWFQAYELEGPTLSESGQPRPGLVQCQSRIDEILAPPVIMRSLTCENLKAIFP